MKVLILDRFFGGRDGPGIYIHDLAKGLLARGHRVALGFGVKKGEHAPQGLEPIEIAGLEKLWGTASSKKKLAQVLDELRPDVASAQCLDVLWFAEQVSRACPLVATFHTHAISCPNWTRLYEDQTLCELDFGPACAWHTVADGCGSARPQAIAANLLRVAYARRMMKHVDAVQAVTPYMRTMLERTGLFAPEKIFDLAYPAPMFDGAREYQKPPGRRILFVGRLHHGKGPQLLVEAAAKMQQPAEMWFVGEGPDEKMLRSRAQQLGVECHFIVGRETVVTREQVSRMYLDASVVVVPSIWGDPAPLVRLEAMAHGRPLVGFDSGGVPSCIEDGVTGFVVPRLDVTALAERLDRLLEDPSLAEKMGRMALQRTHEKYHPDLLASHIEDVYLRLRRGNGAA